MENSEKELYKQVDLGIQCISFVESPIGSYLFNKIENDIKSRLYMLKDIDPFDTNSVLKLQTEIKAFELGKKYLLQAIQEGKAAQAALDLIEENDGDKFDRSIYTNDNEELDFFDN